MSICWIYNTNKVDVYASTLVYAQMGHTVTARCLVGTLLLTLWQKQRCKRTYVLVYRRIYNAVNGGISQTQKCKIPTRFLGNSMSIKTERFLPEHKYYNHLGIANLSSCFSLCARGCRQGCTGVSPTLPTPHFSVPDWKDFQIQNPVRCLWPLPKVWNPC